MSSEQNFSFLELNNIISKQYSHQDKEHFSSNRPKLKFEPNLNVKRNLSSSVERKDKEEAKKTTLINDIAKNFEGEISLIRKPRKDSHSKPVHPTNDKQKPQVPIEVTLKKEKAKTRTSDFGLATAINAIKAKDPTAYVPIILPFKESTEEKPVTTGKDIIAKEGEVDEGDLFLVQFPRQIPIDLPLQEKEKSEETSNEEPQYDSKGFLIKPEFQNVFKELPKNTPLGKLKVFRSGKVQMQINDVLFDIVPGINTKFAQEISVITKEDTNQAVMLGKVNQRKLIAVPLFH